MIKLKTPEEIEVMVEGGKISNAALQELLKSVKPGVTTLELDRIGEETILSNGGKPSFMTVEDYPHATCININEGIVHGLPGDYKIQEGDIVSVDLGTLYKGFHTDLSYTVEVNSSTHDDFLETGKIALKKGIKQCRRGKKIGDISHAIQTEVEKAGYSVSEMLVGHGIGRELHEDPYVSCSGKPGTGHKIKVGMVFAVEVIYQYGNPGIGLSSDGWTLETLDKSKSGLFEKTVAVTNERTVLITDF